MSVPRAGWCRNHCSEKCCLSNKTQVARPLLLLRDGVRRENQWTVLEDSNLPRRSRKGLIGLFFGFMLEDDTVILSDDFQPSQSDESPIISWNSLNSLLFVACALTTAAAATPVTLVPAVGQSLHAGDAAFAPRVTAYAVLGAACGKIMLSCLGDICGARRTSVVCSVLGSMSLLGLAFCQTEVAASWAYFFVEFFASVHWPCIIIILASHYRGCDKASYETGIFVTSLASRIGAVVGIPTTSLLLRIVGWRAVALAGAWTGLVSSSIVYLFISDSPSRVNDSQNPVDPQVLAGFRRKPHSVLRTMGTIANIFHQNVLPSVRHVLKSPSFYIVALAHTGASAIRTSERLLGSYYLDTSLRTLSENQASCLAVSLSFGTIFGLILAGRRFAEAVERKRKHLVIKLYILTIASCYVLAILSMPWVRVGVNAPSLVITVQVMTTFTMGFGIAVQLYQIPSLVGATFGCDKGLYAGWTDGVAYGLSSIVWRLVGKSVQGDDNDAGGWAYAWAAVALILILSAILMAEFMEHYFVRPGALAARGYETILQA